MNFNLEKVPGWAYSWCYYFAAIGIASVVVGFIGLFTVKRTNAAMTLLFLIATFIQAATAMTLFWMCRSSLGSGTVSSFVDYAPASTVATSGEWYAKDVNPDYGRRAGQELVSQFGH
jgi:hypothetical protein